MGVDLGCMIRYLRHTMRYYIISNSEDGDISIYSYTKQGLLEALADENEID